MDDSNQRQQAVTAAAPTVAALLCAVVVACQVLPVAGDRYAATSAALAEACVTVAQCPTPDLCHVALCLDGVCRSEADPQKPSCCDPAALGACDDKNACTLDQCKAQAGGWGQCLNIWLPDSPTGVCCNMASIDASLSCSDSNPCTVDSCVKWHCKHILAQGCCQAPKDCDDGQPCTKDGCTLFGTDAAGVCVHFKTRCVTAADCDDGKACTTDSCVALSGACTHTAAQGDCCETDAACADTDPCTVTACVNHNCVVAFDADKPGCCPPQFECCTDQDAACNDGNACTIDYCQMGNCHHQPPKNGCCANNADCATAAPKCNPGSCSNVTAGKGSCTYLDFCECAPGWPVLGYDPSPCVVNTCVVVGGVAKVVTTKVANCCQDDFECDDKDPKTADYCFYKECVHIIEP